jgi:hypothetical protein
VNEGVAQYIWSIDGSSLYFTLVEKPTDWWVYKLTDGTKHQVDDDEVPQKTIIRSDPDAFNLPGQVLDLFFSPSGDRAIYSISLSELPTMVPSDEGEILQGIEPIIDIYWVEKSKGEMYLGQIKGAILDVLWSTDESKVLLDMGYSRPVPLGPAFAWFSNLKQGELVAIFPRESTKHHPLLKGFSQDGEWILYARMGPDNDFIFAHEIRTKNEIVLPIRSNSLFWWLPDHKKLFVVEYYKNFEDQKIFIYDLSSNEIVYQTIDTVVKYHPWASVPILPSPDFTKLAIIWADTQHIFILDLCAPPQVQP